MPEVAGTPQEMDVPCRRTTDAVPEAETAPPDTPAALDSCFTVVDPQSIQMPVRRRAANAEPARDEASCTCRERVPRMAVSEANTNPPMPPAVTLTAVRPSSSREVENSDRCSAPPSPPEKVSVMLPGHLRPWREPGAMARDVLATDTAPPGPKPATDPVMFTASRTILEPLLARKAPPPAVPRAAEPTTATWLSSNPAPSTAAPVPPPSAESESFSLLWAMHMEARPRRAIAPPCSGPPGTRSGTRAGDQVLPAPPLQPDMSQPYTCTVMCEGGAGPGELLATNWAYVLTSDVMVGTTPSMMLPLHSVALRSEGVKMEEGNASTSSGGSAAVMFSSPPSVAMENAKACGTLHCMPLS